MAVLEYILIAFVVPMVSSKSSGGQFYKTPNDTQTCVNDLVAWCEGMKYPTDGGSISMVSVTIVEHRGYCNAICTSDSDGTNCTKNGSPWFSCSNKNELIYKGNVLTKDSVKGADNDTCKTANNAFNDLFVQNLSYDNSTLQKETEKGLEQLFKAIENMEEKLATMQRKLGEKFGSGFPFGSGSSYGSGSSFGSGSSYGSGSSFGGAFPFGTRNPGNPYYPTDVNTKFPPRQDQREKE